MRTIDTEIKPAERIGRAWTPAVKIYPWRDQFIKKQTTKCEKDAGTTLPDAIGNSAHTNADRARGIAWDVAVIQDRIEDSRAEIDRPHGEPEKGALTEPRTSMAPIHDRLKLGGSKTEAIRWSRKR